MKNKLIHFFVLPFCQKKMVMEVIFLSARYRWLVKHIPFKKYAADLGDQGEKVVDYSEKEWKIIAETKYFVEKICNNMPWECVCLVRAFSASRMLAKRDIVCNTYMGVCKNDAGGMCAHAWTKCGNEFITGETGVERFKVTGIFHNL